MRDKYELFNDNKKVKFDYKKNTWTQKIVYRVTS